MGCGGNMESAVEALLSMTGGVPSSAQPSQQPKQQKQKQKQSQHQQAASKQQQSSVNLADDFLRPPSYFLSKYESNHEFDKENSNQRQIIEDELFAKALFEDSLFTADLQANPEWVLEEINASKSGSNKKKQNKNNKFQ